MTGTLPVMPSVVLATVQVDLGNVLGPPAIDFAIKHLDNFRTALTPLRGRLHLRAVIECQRIRQFRIRIRGVLIVGRGEVGTGPLGNSVIFS